MTPSAGHDPLCWPAFYYHYCEYPQPHHVQPHYGVRTKDFALISFPMANEWELYDMRKDPQQMKSVYDDPAYAGDVKRLKETLRDLQQQYGDTNPDVTYDDILDQIRKRDAQQAKPAG